MRTTRPAATSLILRTNSKPIFAFNVLDLNQSFLSQDETSEMFIGEWMEARGIRDEIVIATKVALAQSRIVS